MLFTALGRGRLSGLGGDRLTGAQLGVDLFNQDCVAIGTVSLILALAPDGSFLALASGWTALRGDLTAPRRFGQPLEATASRSVSD